MRLESFQSWIRIRDENRCFPEISGESNINCKKKVSFSKISQFCIWKFENLDQLIFGIWVVCKNVAVFVTFWLIPSASFSFQIHKIFLLHQNSAIDRIYFGIKCELNCWLLKNVIFDERGYQEKTEIYEAKFAPVHMKLKTIPTCHRFYWKTHYS